jgi:ubiquinone/menaquinone biosynthesis C-methylase UbiE
MSKEKNWTGERLETFISGETMTEHLHRYAIAIDLVKGKNVLDIACGEGYGANLLAQHAAHVTGADIDSTTIANAKSKYCRENLSFLTCSVENIPFPDTHFDAVVSFETIEHTTNHEKMLQEIKRVLKPDGVLIISTPDKKNYSEGRNFVNNFHVKELAKNEFAELLKPLFLNILFFEQRFVTGSFIKPEKSEGFIMYEGDYDKINYRPGLAGMYMIALACDMPLQLPAMSFFDSKVSFEAALREQENWIKKTKSYRLGHAILWPFKWVKSFFKKK